MTNTNATRTVVSKATTATAKIIAATFPDFSGRRVTVIEASAGWYHMNYCGDNTTVRVYHLASGNVTSCERPTYGGAAIEHKAIAGCAVVMLSRFMGSPAQIEIIVCPFDADAMAVAVDTVLAVEPSSTAKTATAKARKLPALHAIAREHCADALAGELFCDVAIGRAVVTTKAAA